jgi:hypothetical protein
MASRRRAISIRLESVSLICRPAAAEKPLVAGKNWSDGNHLQKELYVAWSKSVNA